ncbi:MAG: formate/nitrite transporter family protein [Dorea sp.]
MDSMFNTPQEVVQANMNGAVKKAATSKKKVFFMGIMAGVCIALGAQSSNVAMHDISNVGLARLAAGCVFPVGLMMIVFIGGELFTGDCMMTMACIKRKISVASHPYSGNCIFQIYCRKALAYLVYLSGQYNYTSGALGAFTIKVALGKVSLSFLPALISGILCNILVCAAVLMASTAKDIAGKSLAIFFPIMAFVISGFEHCVANMYYIPAGIFASMNADYVAKAKELYGITESQIASLNWGNFFLVNLLPVTIGNIIGGGFIIGGLFFYLHGKNCK